MNAGFFSPPDNLCLGNLVSNGVIEQQSYVKEFSYFGITQVTIILIIKI